MRQTSENSEDKNAAIHLHFVSGTLFVTYCPNKSSRTPGSPAWREQRKLPDPSAVLQSLYCDLLAKECRWVRGSGAEGEDTKPGACRARVVWAQAPPLATGARVSESNGGMVAASVNSTGAVAGGNFPHQ